MWNLYGTLVVCIDVQEVIKKPIMFVIFIFLIKKIGFQEKRLFRFGSSLANMLIQIRFGYEKITISIFDFFNSVRLYTEPIECLILAHILE